MHRWIPTDLPAAARWAQAPVLRLFWRYRVALAGLSALALALWGEQMMRGAGGGSPGVGTGLVGRSRSCWWAWSPGCDKAGAWFRPHRPISRPWPRRPPSLPVRRAGQASAVQVAAVAPGAPASAAPGRIRAAWDRLQDGRARLGWAGTVVGLVMVAGLAGWCFLLLRTDFGDPLAPWVWGAALVAWSSLSAGIAPPAPGLVPHDPAEPAAEPPMAGANGWPWA